MTQAIAPFDLDSFDEEAPFHEDLGIRYARARIGKTFHGGVEAKSTVEMLSVRAQDGSAGYVALERIVGSVQGRSGSFALLHIGTMTGKDQWAKWPIVPGSGTDELAGISGEAHIEVASNGAHTLVLDYELH